ncbi:type IV secretory system conjugative DNA transfer family protein [Shewanella sp. 4t3-1-2LB]|uniref:type IV secretory system conjugative DNA transfer family protein n=1 Tax=Shewanella sp. 4t3-1-2LB TaxID=2817682 RepID=UPI001A983D60|nr:type IV secretory system conjugative DNA transfer family protein [Shewanella sp. 4t3-1-2LB]MBO1272877.1 type IV secretory system conjugative DNA transfer family protein [Shewanella sp. 4t3-1-2LB]
MKLNDHNNRVGGQTRSSSKKQRFMPMALVSASVLVGLQTATQHFARTFGYQPQLGDNLHHIYWPYKILSWAFDWYSVYPDQFIASGSIGFAISTCGLIAALANKIQQSTQAKGDQYLHGSARWANRSDIENAGLLKKSGNAAKDNDGDGTAVYVGAWVDNSGVIHYLRHSGPEHVLTYAPTRSGKGVGLVIPTLLSWRQSAFISDLKGELWALTAGWRKSVGQKVLRFEPASRQTICWNPIDEIRVGTDFEVGDIQNLCTLIVDPDGKGLNDHWQKTAFSLMCGLVVHVIYKSLAEGKTATLPAIDAILSEPNRDISKLWIEMVTYPHVDGAPHPLASAAGQDMIDRPEEEAGSVLSTAKSYLMLYRDPVVAATVSKSEFKIKDLMHHVDPVSLYIITQPVDKERLKPLVRIMVNMIIRLLAADMQFKGGRAVSTYKHRLLGMIDEFPSLGKLEVLQESLAFVAGYGIKFYLICQDLNQLKSEKTGYGRDEQITSNCHVQNAFPPNRLETAQHLANLTGETTIVKEQITTSGKRFGIGSTNVSRTFTETKRTLLTPDECMRLPAPIKNMKGEITKPGDMVIYVAGYPAIYGRQILYFQDPVFKARAAIDAPTNTDTLRTPVSSVKFSLND